jgi:hypothetical protein
VLVVHKLDNQLDDDPHANGYETSASNLGHDFLEVGDVVGGSNQRGSPAKFKSIHFRPPFRPA